MGIVHEVWVYNLITWLENFKIKQYVSYQLSNGKIHIAPKFPAAHLFLKQHSLLYNIMFVLLCYGIMEVSLSYLTSRHNFKIYRKCSHGYFAALNNIVPVLNKTASSLLHLLKLVYLFSLWLSQLNHNGFLMLLKTCENLEVTSLEDRSPRPSQWSHSHKYPVTLGGHCDQALRIKSEWISSKPTLSGV